MGQRGRKRGCRRRGSLSLLHDAIVYIDSVTVRELFVLTVEGPSQQAITTISVPSAAHCAYRVRIGWCVRGQTAHCFGRRLFLFSLCRAAYAFDMRIKG